MKWSVFLFLAHIGICLCQLPEPINFSNREKCERISGPGTYEKLQAANAEAKICIQGLFDMSMIQIEINQAKTNGSLRNVFGRYCAKVDELNDCLKKQVDTLALCLEEEDRKYLPIVANMWRKFEDFACENSGEKFASFIENGGIECAKSRIEQITECVMKTFPFNSNLYNNFGILNLQTDKKSCDDYATVQKCIVKDLQNHCPKKVPAETVDMLFKLMQGDICGDKKIIRRKRGLKRIVRSLGAMSNKLPHIEKAIKGSCVKNGHPSDKLESDLDKFKACLQKKQLFVAPKHEYLANFESCSKETIKLLETCLPERFKYFPVFMFNLAKSIISLLYDDFIIIQSELGPCLPKLKQEQNRLEYERCVENAGQMHDDELPPSKAAFCAKFIPASQCFTNQLRDVCKHSNELDKFRADYMKAMEEPCK